MLKPGYKLTLGAATISSTSVSSAEPLISLRTDADLSTPAATLDAWFGNPSGVSVAAGDLAKLELGYDGSLTTVFTGVVDRVRADLARLHIQALADMAKLLRLRINQVYENQTSGQIVADLAGLAGVRTGTIQSGLSLPFYVIDDARNAYQHCRDLAERAGFDLYVTPEGQLTFAAFNKVAPDHLFTYAQDVLALEVAHLPQTFSRVEVWGESPASSEGAEAANWLVRDFSSTLGVAGSGNTLRLADPAIRTKEAAVAAAEGRLGALTRRATFGTAVVVGAANVALADAVTFVQAPDDRLRGVFQVKRVLQRFSKSHGFTTRLELWSSSGRALGGLL
jgi:hypothetical protein